MVEQNRLLDLSDYWRMVRKRIWLPIVFAVIVAGLAAAFILAKDPTFLARTKVQVLPIVTLSSARDSSGSSGEPELATEVEIVSSVRVAELVRENLPTEMSADELLKGVRVDVAGDSSSVMYIGYEDLDADAAQRLANAFADAYLQDRVADERAKLDAKIGDVNDQIVDAETKVAEAQNNFERNLWFQKRGQLRAERTELENIRDGLQGGRLYTEATRPESPTGPGQPPVIITGALLGALIGAIFAIGRGLLEGWNDRERA